MSGSTTVLLYSSPLSPGQDPIIYYSILVQLHDDNSSATIVDFYYLSSVSADHITTICSHSPSFLALSFSPLASFHEDTQANTGLWLYKVWLLLYLLNSSCSCSFFLFTANVKCQKQQQQLSSSASSHEIVVPIDTTVCLSDSLNIVISVGFLSLV